MSNLSYQQSLSQQQTLAPQMRKSLEVLQASTMELSQMVSLAMEVNPVLEEVRLVDSDGDLGEEEWEEDADSLAYLNETDDDWRDRRIEEGRSNPWLPEDEEKRQWLYESLVAPESLAQHLQEQLAMSMVDKEVKAVAEVLLGCLDERGFFEEKVDVIRSRYGWRKGVVKAAVALIQSFEPLGVGAEGLADSLRLQAVGVYGEGSMEHRLVTQYLDELARKQYPSIAKSMGVVIEAVVEAADRVRRLTPNPGAEYEGSRNPEVLPDVIVEKNEMGDWEARLTGEGMPVLRINDFYKDLIGKEHLDEKSRMYLRDQIRDGRGLMKAIALRQETILAIAHHLIRHQGEFFEKGVRQLRPMRMVDVAEELGVHATTVSRAVAGKYIKTPHGVYEMRRFFATGYQVAEGEEVSNVGVREEIQRMIAQEDRRKPMSDEAIVKGLAAQGIVVARRTVTKYREQLNVLPSYLRREYY